MGRVVGETVAVGRVELPKMPVHDASMHVISMHALGLCSVGSNPISASGSPSFTQKSDIIPLENSPYGPCAVRVCWGGGGW